MFASKLSRLDHFSCGVSVRKLMNWKQAKNFISTRFQQTSNCCRTFVIGFCEQTQVSYEQRKVQTAAKLSCVHVDEQMFGWNVHTFEHLIWKKHKRILISISKNWLFDGNLFKKSAEKVFILKFLCWKIVLYRNIPQKYSLEKLFLEIKNISRNKYW